MLKKIEKGVKNKNQGATTFFLAHLFNIVQWKNLLDLLLVQKKCTTFYFMKTMKTLKNLRKIILRRTHSKPWDN
jgi:hypothetical protein